MNYKDLQALIARDIQNSIDRQIIRDLKRITDDSYDPSESISMSQATLKRNYDSQGDDCRYVGFPDVGTVKVSDTRLKAMTGDLPKSFEELIKEYVPDAYVVINGQFTFDPLPSFSVDHYDLAVEENVRREGPTWGEYEEYYYYVLYVEGRLTGFPLLYANSPDLLTWAALNFVYAEYNLHQFRSEFFEALFW